MSDDVKHPDKKRIEDFVIMYINEEYFRINGFPDKDEYCPK